MNSDELLKRGLPKWPQHVVTGVPVTVEQAKEIIRRTDSFFQSFAYVSENDAFAKWIQKICGYARPFTEYPYSGTPEQQRAWRDAFQREQDEYDSRWKPLSTELVHNAWISSSFVYGAHGWCHPSGRIGFVDNVGKWPSIEDVRKDWVLLAEAFPFLEIGATLWSGESSEEGTTPVVSFRIKGGSVELVDPSEVDVHAGHPEAARFARTTPVNLGHDSVIPREWIEEWAAKYGKKAE